MDLSEKEKRLIIMSCEMVQKQLNLNKWRDWFFKYTQLTETGRKLFKKSSNDYLKLVYKLKEKWDINEKIFLNKI